MGKPLVLVENFFNRVMFAGHTISADEEASGFEAFRVGTGRRGSRNAWKASTANADHRVTAVCDRLRGADMIVLDRGSNLSGQDVKLQASNDGGTTWWDVLDLTLPDLTIPGGSVDDASGAVTEEGAWLKRFDLDAATRWSLLVPAAVGLVPQVSGLYLGKSWELSSLLDLPWSEDQAELRYDAVMSDAGWEGATEASRRRTGTMRVKLNDYFEYDLARYHLTSLFGDRRRHPMWILYDLDLAERAVLARRPQGTHGFSFAEGWGYRQADVNWVEHEAEVS